MEYSICRERGSHAEGCPMAEPENLSLAGKYKQGFNDALQGRAVDSLDKTYLLGYTNGSFERGQAENRRLACENLVG